MEGSWDAPITFSTLQAHERDIAHAVLLPNAVDSPNDFAHILFWCRVPQILPPSAQWPYQTYHWFQRVPGNAAAVPLNEPIQGHYIKCGSHVFLSDGRLLVTGGTDKPVQTLTSEAGTQHVYSLDPFAATLTWTYQGQDLTRRRWYSTALRLPNDEVIVVGGGGTHGGTPTPEDTYEFRDWNGVTHQWNSQIPPVGEFRENRTFLGTPSGNPCLSTLLRFSQYPRRTSGAHAGDHVDRCVR